MLAAILLLLALQPACGPPPAAPTPAPTPTPAQPGADAAPQEELRQQAIERELVDWGHPIPLPDLRSTKPIRLLRRLSVVNATGRTLAIEAADYPGSDETEILSVPRLRPGAAATLTLALPPGTCRARLVTRPAVRHGAVDVCRQRRVTLRR